MEIRAIRPSDAEAVRMLCLDNTPMRCRLESERFVIWQTFGQYYFDCEAAHCFVAEEDGRIVGAILCAVDYVAYLRRFGERVAPKCKPYGYSAQSIARQTILLHKKVAGGYPAHMQCHWPQSRSDLAQPLFAALAAHLEPLECRGICAFTERQPQLYASLSELGFTALRKNGKVFTMGKELY